MRKLIFILIFSVIYNVKAQKTPVYKDVNICGREGMSEVIGFNMKNEKRYISIIKDFEKEFKKINNGYSDYYRVYHFVNWMNPTDLFVSLIPKEIVPEEQKKKKEFRVFGDDRTLEVFYDLKTRKISEPKKRIINPDL
ncbi:hypothetical protein [Elizabethkingia anophelis]|uniref:Uncharacterized protein n=1 Tax=Elizabethkingia anophelis TaxID=1117645 RepID=A0AAU8US31_9FLAO|nr:hypothetical protein [Elizabethkingia anophelis]AQX00891.1 hypothetical protein BBD32_05175 [Elizabethkingia anophelis]MYY49811.1 hypothetical protein [Elizabethkingia anophelis]OPB65639.1 hypothetical protein BAY11_15460 [Elizabethkingia anophelis]